MGRDNKGRGRHTVEKPGIGQEVLHIITGGFAPAKSKHTVERDGRKGTGYSRSEAEKNWRKDKKR